MDVFIFVLLIIFIIISFITAPFYVSLLGKTMPRGSDDPFDESDGWPIYLSMFFNVIILFIVILTITGLFDL